MITTMSRDVSEMGRQTNIRRVIRHLPAVLFLWMLAAVALAAAPLDIVLVMDSSGSMKKNDPQELRKPAARLLISLLDGNDRVSVVSFSDQGYPIVYLTPNTPDQSQARLFGAVEKISSKGAYTNITAALEAAGKVLERDADEKRRRMIVLMSDGRMDLGDARESRQAIEAALTGVVPGLKEKGVAIHTIAFTDESDTRLLQSIASLTGGQFNLAQTDKELHRVFAAIFEQSKTPDVIPFKGKTFQIDASVKEITIVAGKDGRGEVVTLTSPANEILTAQAHGDFTRWMESPEFDLITIKEPKPGAWQISPVAEGNRAYVITDLKLHVDFTPVSPQPGDSLLITSWLEDGGSIITKPEVLGSVELGLNASLPEKTSINKQVDPVQDATQAPSGKYQADLALDKQGRYSIVINAIGATFDRQMVKILDLVPPITPEEALHAVTHKDDKVFIDLSDSAPTTFQVAETPAPPAPLGHAVKEHAVIESPVPTPAAVKETAHPQPSPAAVPHAGAEEESGIMFGIVIFVVVNLVVGLAAAAVYFFVIKKKAAPAAPADTDATAKKRTSGEKPSPAGAEQSASQEGKRAALAEEDAAREEIVFEEMKDNDSDRIAKEMDGIFDDGELDKK